MTELRPEQNPGKRQLRQMAIVSASLLLLTLTCCGGSAAFEGNSSGFLASLSSFLTVAGLILFAAFVCSILIAIGIGLLELIGRLGR